MNENAVVHCTNPPSRHAAQVNAGKGILIAFLFYFTLCYVIIATWYVADRFAL